jgi:hypothetical protein
MAKAKNVNLKRSRDSIKRPRDSETTPRKEATRDGRQGRWGRPEQDDERFGHSPAAGGDKQNDQRKK